MEQENADISLSAMTRLRLTFDRELSLDKAGEIFGEDRYRRYVQMSEISEQKQTATLKSVLIADAFVALATFGTTFNIPVLNVSVGEIPAAREVLTWWASIGFFFLCIAFINTQSYSAILDIFHQRTARAIHTDPDFVGASERHFDFAIKLYREKYNLWGFDFFAPEPGFIRYGKIVLLLIILAILSLPAAHLTIVILSSAESVRTSDGCVLISLYLATIFLLNASGVFMIATMLKDFRFRISSADQPELSQPQPIDQPPTLPKI